MGEAEAVARDVRSKILNRLLSANAEEEDHHRVILESLEFASSASTCCLLEGAENDVKRTNVALHDAQDVVDHVRSTNSDPTSLEEPRRVRDELFTELTKLITAREALKKLVTDSNTTISPTAYATMVLGWVTALVQTGQGGDLEALVKAHDVAFATYKTAKARKKAAWTALEPALERQCEIEAAGPLKPAAPRGLCVATM